MAKAASTKKQPGFEHSMTRLETIVNDMEGGELSLEEMIARFEEGQTLIKSCTKTLNEVERKIEVLVKKGDDVVAVPFEGEADVPAEAIASVDDELF
jgi:exodeoxyribonuclease VII small subunit